MAQKTKSLQNAGGEEMTGEPPFPLHVIEQFVDNQRLTLQNQTNELKLREKELELNAKQAEKIIDSQSDLAKNYESEKRKTVTRYAYIGGGILLLVFAFILCCLYLNKEDFILKFVQIIGYVVTTIVGYWFGKQAKSGRTRKADQFDDAQIVS